ncbi:MAG: trigger factor [Candidatus Daviesbacteria bacterium]|nr:trigger factor [Candidatus Daviesbacteria bacterium]
MITKNINSLPKSLIEVEITVPWADLEIRWNEVLLRLSAEVELPGFRKGQAPKDMVEQSLGNKLSEEVFRVVFPEKLVEALQGTEIVPIDYPRYQLVSFIKGQSVVYKASVTKRPEVKIGDYKNIKAQRPIQKVITEEDVNKLVEDLFKRWKTKQPVGGVEAPDDNFAKAVGASSLTDLRTKLKTDLENEAKYNNELDYEEAILQEVEKVTTVEIPDVLIEDELNRMLVSLQRRVADMGLLMEDYLKGQGETSESIKNKWRPQAEKNVRMELGLAEVGRLEKVEISDSEVQAEIDKIQDAKLKTQFEQQEPRLHLRHSLRQIKTLDLLKKVTQPHA